MCKYSYYINMNFVDCFMLKTIRECLNTTQYDIEVNVLGWVRTKRESKNIVFITLNDGSTFENLQTVLNLKDYQCNILSSINTGCSVKISGKLIKSSGSGQSVEVQIYEIKLIGEANDYPIQPKRHTMEFLRTIAHLRFRTNTFSAVFRIRNAVCFAIHKFFQQNGFIYIHTPLITSSDTEGAGEMFTVTTLLNNKDINNIDYSNDFFGTHTGLTVSGQLEAEAAIFGLGKVYTFGPTFRAENSNTTRHLAEFWMVEPEMAFFNLQDNINLSIDFLKYIINEVLVTCPKELEFLDKCNSTDNNSLLTKLHNTLENDFQIITYSEAIDILKQSKSSFEYIVKEWGIDLQTEHERYLVEHHFKKPVIVTNYPSDIKAFYMKQNDDGQTVAAMDVLFPGIGEIIGGSQREESLEKLKSVIQKRNMDMNILEWYLDTRRYGSIEHSGFGLGLERLVLFLTGMTNIRDVIPFPRTPRNANF